jgi:hypothetical protein
MQQDKRMGGGCFEWVLSYGVRNGIAFASLILFVKTTLVSSISARILALMAFSLAVAKMAGIMVWARGADESWGLTRALFNVQWLLAWRLPVPDLELHSSKVEAVAGPLAKHEVL